MQAPVTACRFINNTTKLRCLSSRISPACGRAMCKRHCLNAGGCTGTKGHLQEDALPSVAIARTAVSPATLLSPQRRPDLPRILSTSVLPITPQRRLEPSTDDHNDEGDMTRNPHFISHMPSVFRERYATQQCLREQKRREDEERLISKKRAEETVIGYAFVNVSSI